MAPPSPRQGCSATPSRASPSSSRPWRVRGFSEQWREAPPQKVLGELHYLKGALWRRKRQGAFWRCWVSGRSESTKLDRTRGEGELGGTSGDEGDLGGTSGDEGELGGTGWGADSASSWDGAGSGADSASSWDGAGSGADSASSWDGAGSGVDSASSWDGADLGMPAARTDTSGGSNTLVISPGQRGASAGVVAILAGESGLAGLARADSGLAGMMRADSGLAGLLWGSGSAAILWQVSAVEVPMGGWFSSSATPTVKGEPLSFKARSLYSSSVQVASCSGMIELSGSDKPPSKKYHQAYFIELSQVCQFQKVCNIFLNGPCTLAE